MLGHVQGKFYDNMGGLYEKGIIGSGDYIISQGLLGNIACGDNSLVEFKKDIKNYIKKIESVKVGYIPTNIRHHFHGSKVNRKYIERNQILINYKYSPIDHLTHDENGILIPTVNMNDSFISDIKKYFLTEMKMNIMN